MSTLELLPADGDPPEDPAADPALARPDEPDGADAPGTEDPVPESAPPGAARGTDA
jgi:hypothetical protein